MGRLNLPAEITNRLRQLRWRMTVSYALVALATVLVVEWWGLVGASLYLSSELTPLDVINIIGRIAVEIVLPTALALVVPTALVGALFGQITAHWLGQRLDQFNAVTLAWQSGDFSRQIQDRSGDEISELAARMNAMATQLEQLIETRRDLGALEERNHLARELHDTVKQQSLAAAMQLAAVRVQLTSNPAAVADHLKEAEELVHQMQQELTGLIWELRPSGLEDRSLADALRATLETWSRQTRIPFQLQVTGERILSPGGEEALFRICQEALANVARHSQAAQVWVQLANVSGRISLTIRDDGIGFEPGDVDQAEQGLRNMRERAESMGGSLEVESTPGSGTTITARIMAVANEEVSSE